MVFSEISVFQNYFQRINTNTVQVGILPFILCRAAPFRDNAKALNSRCKIIVGLFAGKYGIYFSKDVLN